MTTVRDVGNSIEITTPFLDRHNDQLQIYAKRSSKGFLLSDDGYVLNDLEMSGCKLDTARRQALLKQALKGFNVQCSDNVLEVEASADNFSLRKHCLLQAMLAVNDLLFLVPSPTGNIFKTDVVNWLKKEGIQFQPNVKFPGKNGYEHRFDFVIEKSESRPERVLHTITHPIRKPAESMVFSWQDATEAHARETPVYVLVNDSKHQVTEGVLDLMRYNDVTPYLWSDREAAKHELAA